MPFTCTESDLTELFSPYGEIVELKLPLDDMKHCKGYAFIEYLLPESAIKVINDLDASVFQGRILHILHAKSKEEKEDNNNNYKVSEIYKYKRELEKKAESMKDTSWNALFIRGDTIIDYMSEKYHMKKSEIMNVEEGNMAVRLALAETEVIDETKKFLENEGIDMDELDV